MTDLIIALNADTSDVAYGTSGIDWITVDEDNDYLIITGGSNVVKDGEPIPTSLDLNQAGIEINNGVEVIVSKYLLADDSVGLLKEIHNMGNQNKRYVMAFDFDGATTSEPVLEVWDNVLYNTVISISLGGDGIDTENPNNSFYRGITTTDALPGNNWVGSRLAGSGVGNFLWLNNQNGPLLAAGTLYANIKVVIPLTATVSGAETPVMVCKYTTN